MFGIELDIIKKIEIGFCIVIMAIAGYLILKAAKGTKDETVQGYSDAEVRVGRDDRFPVSATNPIDPNKTYRDTWFINSDGRLQFREFTRKSDGDHRAELHFYPDQLKKVYDCFPTAKQVIAAYKDDGKRVVSEATVQFVTVTKNNNPRAMFTGSTPIFRDLGLPQADLTRINTECDNLIRNIKQVDDDVALGALEGAKYDKVMKALQDFRDCGPGDVSADPKKGAAAKKVMAAGLEYIKIVQDKKLSLISDYVDTVLGALNEEQKNKMISAAAPRTVNRPGGTTRPGGGGGGGGNPPRRRAATQPAI